MNGQRKGKFTSPAGARIAVLALALAAAGCGTIRIEDLKDTPRDAKTVEHIPEELKAGFTRPRASVVAPKTGTATGKQYDGALVTHLNQTLGHVGGLTIVEEGERDRILQAIEQNLSDLTDSSKLGDVPGLEAVTHLLIAQVTFADSSEEDVVIAPAKTPKEQPTTMHVIKASAGISVRIVQVKNGVVLRDVHRQGATTSYFSAMSGSTRASMIDEAIQEAVDAALPDLQEAFPVRGYIVKLKGDAQVALISLGKRQDIGEGRRFRIFQRSKYTDPVGVEREETQTIGLLEAIQIQDDTAWCEVVEGRDQVLVGMEIESLPESRGFFASLFGGW